MNARVIVYSHAPKAYVQSYMTIWLALGLMFEACKSHVCHHADQSLGIQQMTPINKPCMTLWLLLYTLYPT